MKLRKAVIPVAGLGTRFLPATKTVPKELLPIVDIPSIQYVVQEAVDAGIEEIIFVTGRGKDGIEDHFDDAPELEQVLADRGQQEMVKMLRRIAEMTEVVSVRVLTFIENGSNTSAAAVASVMLAVALFVIVALDLVLRRVARRG